VSNRWHEVSSKSRDAVRESSLWKWLKQARSYFNENLHMQRIEASTASVPDVEGCLYGHSFWIELKVAAKPVRADTPVAVTFQPGQPEWLAARCNAGGLAWVLLQVGAEDRLLLHGRMAPHIAGGLTLSRLKEQAYSEPASPSLAIRAAVCFRAD